MESKETIFRDVAERLEVGSLLEALRARAAMSEYDIKEGMFSPVEYYYINVTTASGTAEIF